MYFKFDPFIKPKPTLQVTIDEFGYSKTIWLDEDGIEYTTAEVARMSLGEDIIKTKSNRRLLLLLIKG